MIVSLHMYYFFYTYSELYRCIDQESTLYFSLFLYVTDSFLSQWVNNIGAPHYISVLNLIEGG